MPVGIDPGWAYAPGRSSATGGGSAPPPASPAETILAGRQIRAELDAAVAQAPGAPAPGDAGWMAIWSGELRRRLRTERGAGTVPARASGAGTAQADVNAARMVRTAAERFPGAWVARANATRVSVQHLPAAATLEVSGDYRRAEPHDRTIQTPGRPDYLLRKGRALIRTRPDASTPLHEYVHHLQDALPELDRQFRRLHVRRTTRPNGTRDPVAPLKGYEPATGRADGYIDPYFGAEYEGPGWPEGPLEVMTRTYETIFTGPWSKGVGKLMEKDPELLEFALGALFRYDPT